MNEGPTRGPGSSGPDVRRLQRLLTMLGHLPYSHVDGRYGGSTEAAVGAFQRSRGLPGDGIAGPAVWAALPPDPRTPLLRRGDEGEVVALLQAALTDHGGPGADTDPGPADGFFGPLTEAAVREYQTERACLVDGVVGDETWWVPSGPAAGSGSCLARLAGLTTDG